MIFNLEVYSDVRAKIEKLDDEISAIYFLKYNGNISYIGKSKCVKNRFMQHLYDRKKPFNDFDYIETESTLLDTVESFYILYHSPAFNKIDCLGTTTTTDFVNKNGLDSMYVGIDEYYVNKVVKEIDKPTLKKMARYYGITTRTFNNWSKATDGREKAYEALKAYYITQKGIG